jgi:hypothetical protein
LLCTHLIALRVIIGKREEEKDLISGGGLSETGIAGYDAPVLLLNPTPPSKMSTE